MRAVNITLIAREWSAREKVLPGVWTVFGRAPEEEKLVQAFNNCFIVWGQGDNALYAVEVPGTGQGVAPYVM